MQTQLLCTKLTSGRDTADSGVSSPAGRAGAHRLVDVDLTEGVLSAGILQDAGVSADLIQACLVHRTFGVVRADRVQRLDLERCS